MFKWIFKKKKAFEYLYFYISDLDIFSDEEAKKKINLTIKEDVRRYNKELKDRFVFESDVNKESLHIVASKQLNFIFFQPIILELYAFFKKNKDFSMLTYDYEILNIKHSNKNNNQSMFLNDTSKEKTINIFKIKVDVR